MFALFVGRSQSVQCRNRYLPIMENVERPLAFFDIEFRLMVFYSQNINRYLWNDACKRVVIFHWFFDTRLFCKHTIILCSHFPIPTYFVEEIYSIIYNIYSIITRVSHDICLDICYVRIIVKTNEQLQYTHFCITKTTLIAFSH